MSDNYIGEEGDLSYEGAKTRVKESLRGYISYFANTDAPVIGAANELNALISLSPLEAKVALLCDGRDLGKVLKGFKDIIKSSGKLCSIILFLK